MTSSYKDGAGWDYTNIEFKPFDPTCEPGLISVLFLSSSKLKLTKASLYSTLAAVKNYTGEIEWNFLEQSADYLDTFLFYHYLLLQRKNIIVSQNYGINSGFNKLWGISHGEYCLIHENDFLNIKPDFNFLQHAKDILDEFPDVGLVRLRDPWDPWEQWGAEKADYEPLTCRPEIVADHGIKHWRETTSSKYPFHIFEFDNGYNNNPILMRKSLYRETGPMKETPFGANPREGETDFQRRVKETGCLIAFLNDGVYHHIGGARKKEFGL